MAARKSAYRFFAQSIDSEVAAAVSVAADEFDESDVWGCAIEIGRAAAEQPPARSKPIPSSRSGRKKGGGGDRADRVAAAAASLPVNVPDWSKILKGEYRGNSYSNNNGSDGGRLFEGEEDGDVVTAGAVIPPHELLWRNRAESFSVHEGIGRTLKGRDLRRVRNAIFEKTGFQD